MESDRKYDVGSVESAILSETFFEMPVRLRVGEVELLEWQGRGYPLPLLHMATLGLDSMQELRRSGSANLMLPTDGDLFFELSGEDVVIHSTQTDRIAQAKYDELLHAWEEFTARVREFLSKEFPTLETQPYWGQWVKGGDLPDWGQWVKGRDPPY